MQQNSFYFNDGPYLQTLQGLTVALTQEEALITLIGEARTGKSSVCERLIEQSIQQEYRVVYFDCGIESPEMLQTLFARGLDLPDVHNFFRLLEESVASGEGGGKKPIILIFDDAHSFGDRILSEIYRLTEIQVNMRRILNIILCGEPALEQRLRRRKEFKQLLLLVSHRFYLHPMDRDTLKRFLILYLEGAGNPGLRLDPAAYSAFYELCKGLPGPAASLCRLIVEARSGESELFDVSKTELQGLVRLSSASQNPPRRLRERANIWLVAGPIAAVLFVVALVLLYQIIRSGDSDEAGNEVNAEAAVAEQLTR